MRRFLEVSWDNRADRIDHDGPDFIWEQVAADLRADIESGSLAPGVRLPSESDLASIYGVARGTIGRALLKLKEDGLVVTRFGRGTFVPRP
ncbi:winged helix-turn-helix domain-containing protein [Saccharomonospora sp. NPDC046836]|uniref:winged helix-turn-helix domain-containing protein n=1 Tax=Saccharomonospora sp. NPDC046836 TaxID=3156921 RepID=UPI0033E89160